MSAIFIASIASIGPAFAQEPPLTVPKNRLPATPGDAIVVGDWLLMPTLRFYTLLSDNLFQSAAQPVKTGGFGLAPGLVAMWTNGIHKTAIYGTADYRNYPTTPDFNVFDRQFGVTQTYEALRDLIFTATADYNHQTNASDLQGVIPGAGSSPTNPLPPGTFINSQTIVNPSNTYTGTASVYKILNRAFVRLTGSVSRTEYEEHDISHAASNFTTRSFTGNAGFWLGPMFYAYSDGTFAERDTSGAAKASAFRAVGGIGTARIGLFRGAIYFGQQGSQVDGSGTAGGDIFGGRLTYLATPIWTLNATVEQVTNISHMTTPADLSQGGSGSPLLIPISDSTRVTSTALQSTYQISKLWTTTTSVSYTRAEYLDTTQLDQAWNLYTMLKYDIKRNLSLTLEYQYTKIDSNAPNSSSTRNYVNAGATYKF